MKRAVQASAKRRGDRDRGKMKTEDKSRKWMWTFLATLVLLQMYFVWELLAVLVLFAVGFAAIAFVTGSLYMLHRGWALAVERVADSNTRSWWPRGRAS